MQTKRLEGDTALQYASRYGITHVQSLDQARSSSLISVPVNDAQADPGRHFLDVPDWAPEIPETRFGRVYQDALGNLHLTTLRTIATIPHSAGPDALLHLMALVNQQLEGYDVLSSDDYTLQGATLVAELTRVDTPDQTISLYPHRMDRPTLNAFGLRAFMNLQA